ncbi:MAG: isochorismatase family protein [bacterium]|nr:isochorismatase family protein [bacterium]
MNIDTFTLTPNDTALVIIDIQERLFGAMKPKIQEVVTKNTGILIEISKLYNMPIIVTEQYRKGLGPTISELQEKTNGSEPLEKLYFDCMKDSSINNHINETITKSGKKSIILTGIETHVCVFQTALSLLEKDFRVTIAADAVASRRKHDWKFALESLRQAGVNIYPTETIAFMLLEKAGTPEFKKMAPLFK